MEEDGRVIFFTLGEKMSKNEYILHSTYEYVGLSSF